MNIVYSSIFMDKSTTMKLATDIEVGSANQNQYFES